MNLLKDAIFKEVRNYSKEFETSNYEELNKLIFHHHDSLRLTLSGFILIKKIFTAYSFPIPELLKSKHRMGMSKLEFPYFFTARRLILFSEVDSMVVKLHGGVEGFLEMCSQID